jgi:hypothetical protein
VIDWKLTLWSCPAVSAMASASQMLALSSI